MESIDSVTSHDLCFLFLFLGIFLSFSFGVVLRFHLLVSSLLCKYFLSVSQSPPQHRRFSNLPLKKNSYLLDASILRYLHLKEDCLLPFVCTLCLSSSVSFLLLFPPSGVCNFSMFKFCLFQALNVTSSSKLTQIFLTTFDIFMF